MVDHVLFERPVTGKIRDMNAGGLKRKDDAKQSVKNF